jgi:hypothetical protein
VRVNDKNAPYFQSCKGVRQEDPLSSLLFNFVADALTRMMLKAQSNRVVAGLVEHLISHGIALLQYVDDTILCLKMIWKVLEMSNCSYTCLNKCLG